MSIFLMFGKYSSEAMKDISSDRTEKAREVIQKNGGKGLKSSIEVLKTMREVQTQRSIRRTPYEGVPISVSSSRNPEKE